MKRNLRTAAISMLLLTLVAVLGLSSLYYTATNNAAHAAGKANAVVSTIQGLQHISVVGSTQFIVDGKKNTITVDPNPYGVAIAPKGTPASKMPGVLQPGDIVVTNIGNNDTGMTLVRFPNKMGPGLLFNQVASPMTKGPAGEAFNPTGNDWVANSTGNNVQIFKPNGTVATTLTSPLFNMPWGMAFNQGMPNPNDGATAAFFTSNEGSATIDRIDVIPANGGVSFKVFQIGQLKKIGAKTKIPLTWVPSLKLNGMVLKDVLLAGDPAQNRIAAFPNSSTVNTTTTKSMSGGLTVFMGAPLAMPAGVAINPLNGDLLINNLQKNTMVEINTAQGKVVSTRVVDNVPVDPKTGNGSALFGLVATTDAKGNLEVFFTDDNTNTLDMLGI